MKTLRVGFSSHKSSAFSWLIRTCTKSKVSHAYARLQTQYDQDVIFQASGLVVNMVGEVEFERKAVNVEEYDVPLTEEQYNRAMNMTISELGKPYSIKQVFGFLYVLTMRNLGKKVSNPFSDGTHAYVCVELIADMLGLSNAESMTPEDLRRWCEENAFKVV